MDSCDCLIDNRITIIYIHVPCIVSLPASSNIACSLSLLLSSWAKRRIFHDTVSLIMILLRTELHCSNYTIIMHCAAQLCQIIVPKTF